MDGTALNVVFDEDLDSGSTPAPEAFTVTVDGETRAVVQGGVAVSGAAVTLTLSSAVVAGEDVTVAYTPPDTSPLQDAASNPAASFSEEVDSIRILSNLDTTRDGWAVLGTSWNHAQPFTTGSNPSGYRLVRVELFVLDVNSTAINVSIRSSSSSGDPDTSAEGLVGKLAQQSPNGKLIPYEASGGITLESDTTYFVFLELDGPSQIAYTQVDRGKGRAAAGWSIGDRYRWIQLGVPGWRGQSRSMMLVVHVGAVLDYDSDDDGLIEIRNAAQLDAVRWDPDGDGAAGAGDQSSYEAAFSNAEAGMGCPAAGCTGYEIGAGADGELPITVDLGAADYSTGMGWEPIGGYRATFDGNGSTVSGLFIDRSSVGVGLFGSLAAGGEIRNVNLTGVDIRGAGNVGALVGRNAGTVRSSSATGAIAARASAGVARAFGGLVGRNEGAIETSYADVTITLREGAISEIGGLAGRLHDGATIRDSYALGTISVHTLVFSVGGLVGYALDGAVVERSYAAVAQRTSNPDLFNRSRPLIGWDPFEASVTNSYWDRTLYSYPVESVAGEGRTSAELKAGTDDSDDIFVGWSPGVWNFGTGCSYPVLVWQGQAASNCSPTPRGGSSGPSSTPRGGGSGPSPGGGSGPSPGGGSSGPSPGGGSSGPSPGGGSGPSPGGGSGPSSGGGSDPSPGSGFVDTAGSVHEDAIERIAAVGITVGCSVEPPLRYCPDRPVTRAQMASFLARALDLPAAAAPAGFVDTAGGVHEDAIERIAAVGITVGCSVEPPLRYCPDRPVTRAQMASFLARALDLPAAAAPAGFVDTAGGVHEDAIERIAAVGITVGCSVEPPLRYCPDRPVTRAQMASFLARALDLPSP